MGKGRAYGVGEGSGVRVVWGRREGERGSVWGDGDKEGEGVKHRGIWGLARGAVYGGV